MNRNIAKQFTATLSLLDVASDKTHKYKCFHGEDIQLTVNVVGENNRLIDLSNTSVKIYFTLDKNVNEPVYRQDTGIVVDNLGIITVMLEKSYIRIGNNTLKIVLYDEDQTVFLQPLIISCIDPLIGELPDLEIPDDIDVRDELYDIRRIIGDLQDFDDDSGREITEARNEYGTVGERLDNFDSQLDNKVNQNELIVNVKDFGALGDGVNDDYNSFIKAIEYCNANKRTLYIPKGEYLLGGILDFSSLPIIENGVDYRYTFKIVGEECGSTILKAKTGVNKIIYYNPVDKTRYKKFDISNLSFRSEEPFDDLNIRGDCTAIELLCSPNSIISNIDIMGINEGIHLKYCWVSTLENIACGRVRRGIHIDGVGDDGATGLADHVYMNRIQCGGWVNEYGLKISHSTSSTLTNFDSESGNTGNSIVIEACHNLNLKALYFESFANASPILVKGNDTIKTIEDFSTNIEISNAKFYAIKNISCVVIGKGVDGLIIKNSRIFKEPKKLFKGTISNAYKTILLSFAGMSFNNTFNMYYRNIQEINNIGSDYNEKQSKYSDTCLSFVDNNVLWSNRDNLKYGSPTLEKGMTIYPSFNTYWDYAKVLESGTYNTLHDVTCNCVSGSQVITVNDISNLYVNTYILINGTIKNKILGLDVDTKKVYLSTAITSDLSNVSLEYSLPIIDFKLKANYNFESEEENLKNSLFAGEYYFDKTKKVPYFYDGHNFYGVVQGGNGIVQTSNTSQVIQFNKPYGSGLYPNVVAVSRKAGAIVSVLSVTNTGFTIQSDTDSTPFYYIATTS